MKKILFALVIYFFVISSSWAEIYVVVHKESKIESLSKSDVSALFLGKKRTLPNGELALVIDRGGSSLARSDFFFLLNNMSLSRVNAYWSRLTFSGRMTPPTVIEMDNDMFQLLSEHYNAISYTNQKPVDPNVNVILYLQREDI